jgi:hypothetical protein
MQTSNTSLHSIGTQSRRHGGSRSNLLRGILNDVREIKRQQGMEDSDMESIASDATIRKETLERLYRDVEQLKEAGAHGNATTQTVQEQTTQTAMRMLEGPDPQQQARQERLQGMLAELRNLKGEGNNDNATPSLRVHSTTQSVLDFDQQSRSLARTTPAKFESPAPSPVPTSHHSHAPTPAVNGYGGVHFAYPPETSYSMPALNHTAPPPGGNRRVTQQDLNAISERLDRLQGYQMPRRHLPMAPPPVQLPSPPPPPPPPVMMMPPPPPARRYRVREFRRSFDDLDALSDESEYGGGRRGGRRRGGRQGMRDVRGRYHLDDALEEANKAARELKRMSTKMRRNLRDELGKHGY